MQQNGQALLIVSVSPLSLKVDYSPPYRARFFSRLYTPRHVFQPTLMDVSTWRLITNFLLPSRPNIERPYLKPFYIKRGKTVFLSPV